MAYISAAPSYSTYAAPPSSGGSFGGYGGGFSAAPSYSPSPSPSPSLGGYTQQYPSQFGSTTAPRLTLQDQGYDIPTVGGARAAPARRSSLGAPAAGYGAPPPSYGGGSRGISPYPGEDHRPVHHQAPRHSEAEYEYDYDYGPSSQGYGAPRGHRGQRVAGEQYVERAEEDYYGEAYDPNYNDDTASVISYVSVSGKRRKKKKAKKPILKPFSQETMNKIAGPGISKYGGSAGAGNFSAGQDDAASVAGSEASNWSAYSAGGTKIRSSSKSRRSQGSIWDGYRAKKPQKSGGVMGGMMGGMGPTGFGDDTESVATNQTSMTVRDELDSHSRANKMPVPKAPQTMDPPMQGEFPPPPPDEESQFSLVDSLCLLWTRDGKFSGVGPSTRVLEYTASAAILAELYHLDKMEPLPNTLRRADTVAFRVLDTERVGDEWLDKALERVEREQRRNLTVGQWIHIIRQWLEGSKMLANICDSLVEHGSLIQTGPMKYDTTTEDAYAEVYGLLQTTTTHRDNGQEAPLRAASLLCLYWLPEDHVNYCFGPSLETWPAKQMLRAMVYSIGRFMHNAEWRG